MGEAYQVKYYTITATRNGKPFPFKREHASQQSLNSLRDFFARYGVELHEEYAYTVPDRALYRKPTDEERAEGVRDDYLVNEKYE